MTPGNGGNSHRSREIILYCDTRQSEPEFRPTNRKGWCPPFLMHIPLTVLPPPSWGSVAVYLPGQPAVLGRLFIRFCAMVTQYQDQIQCNRSVTEWISNLLVFLVHSPWPLTAVYSPFCGPVCHWQSNLAGMIVFTPTISEPKPIS